MKGIASPLNIIDFAITELEYKFIQPKSKDENDIKEHFANYDLDIDFAINSNDIIQVFIKAEINRGETPLPGYSIFAEIACLYEFNKDIEVTEEAKNAIGGFSTIYIALNALRGYIIQVTANAPFGRYILPSVDLNDLIKQKKQALTGSKKKVTPTKKKPLKKIGGN